MKSKILGLLAVGLLAGPMTATATPALTFDEGTGASGINNNQSVGWQFNVTTSVLVTGFGWYDQGGDGLGREHTVGIWDGAGNLLASVLVPSGTSAGLDGQFRTVSIAPILLAVGSGYIVGGQNFSDSGDRLAFDVAFTLDPRFTFVDAMFSDLNLGFVRPTSNSAATTGFFGPSFSVASVPEPGTLALLGLGLAGLGLSRRRKAN